MGRVPGHFELMAGDGDQDLVAKMANASHVIKHLSFSETGHWSSPKKPGRWSGVPQDVIGHISPLDGLAYSTEQSGQVWIHDMVVVSTLSAKGEPYYQFSHQHRVSSVPEGEIPQAQFHYDIEPFSIWVMRDDKQWYDFGTALMAILGGTFVTTRLFSSAAQ